MEEEVWNRSCCKAQHNSEARVAIFSIHCFLTNCLAIYFYGFITKDGVTNLNNYGREAVILESERIVKTL